MKNVLIYSPTKREQLTRILEEANGLTALTEFVNLPGHADLCIEDNTLSISPDWSGGSPPILFPARLPFTEEALIRLVYARLGAFDKALEHLNPASPLYQELWCCYILQQGQEVFPEWLQANEGSMTDHARMHNRAVLVQYGNVRLAAEDRYAQVKALYYEAAKKPCHPEHDAFSLVQLSTLLADHGATDELNQLLNTIETANLSIPARMAVQSRRCRAGMLQVVRGEKPLPENTLTANYQELVQYFAQSGNEPEEGLHRNELAYLLHLAGNTRAALEHNNRAISLFRELEVPELLGEAWMQRGELLHAFAQQPDQKHQYAAAVKSYQESLKIFSREHTPYRFAEIHHQLGLIYTDMPAPEHKKGMLAAIAVSSFEEALSYFTPDKFPYEHASVCNHYGCAYIKFPRAHNADNYDRAIGLLQKALAIRTADEFPEERCLTLLNYLEILWQMPNPINPEGLDYARYEEMVEVAGEIMHTTGDPHLRDAATDHLNELKKLRQTVNPNA